MKKAVIFTILFFAFLAVCSAQNTNYEQRIVGTWVMNNSNQGLSGKIWTFSANGNLTMDGSEIKYGIAGTKLATSFHITTYDVSISSDGKTLILSTYDCQYYWFTKK